MFGHALANLFVNPPANGQSGRYGLSHGNAVINATSKRKYQSSFPDIRSSQPFANKCITTIYILEGRERRYSETCPSKKKKKVANTKAMYGKYVKPMPPTPRRK